MLKFQCPAIEPEPSPWNKGRLVGQKRPLLRERVWTIRTRFELTLTLRYLTMFNLAIASKPRRCNHVRLKVADLVVDNKVRDCVTIARIKTIRPVQFEVTAKTREAIWNWVNSPETQGCDVPLSEPSPKAASRVCPPICPAGA